jgi:hypothetical protein
MTPPFHHLFRLPLLPLSLYLSIYLYTFLDRHPLQIYYKKTNPNVVRSSMHACVLLFLPIVVFLVHAFLPKISFLSILVFFQQPPNTLIPSHLALVCFVDLPCDRLKILHELFCLCLGLCVLLLECIQYLYCNIVVDHPCTFCLGLCHTCFGFFFLCNQLCCSLLEWLHLSLALLFLHLCSYELFL